MAIGSSEKSTCLVEALFSILEALREWAVIDSVDSKLNGYLGATYRYQNRLEIAVSYHV